MSFLRVQRGIVRGKKFATRKRAAEYLHRVNSGTLRCADGGGTCGLLRAVSFDNGVTITPEFEEHNPLVNAKPRKHRPAQGGACRRVYLHGNLWRVTVENIWQSDHATMEDALAGVNSIGIEPGEVKAGLVVVPIP